MNKDTHKQPAVIMSPGPVPFSGGIHGGYGEKKTLDVLADTAPQGGAEGAALVAPVTERLVRERSYFNFCHEPQRQGLSLVVFDACLACGLPHTFSIDRESVAFVVLLAGQADILCDQSGGRNGSSLLALEPGEMVLACSPCTCSTTLFPGEQYLGVAVLAQQKILKRMAGQNGNPPLALAEGKEYPGIRLCWKQHQADAQLKFIARQLLSCTMLEMSRQLFFESKSLEIISIFFDKMKTVDNRQSAFSCGDIERIYTAREMLIKRMEDPPSLYELSRECGINECKLKKGFRLYFNQTVYETLRKERMNKARKLISEHSYSVSDAAYEVGYNSLSRFISAFKNEFGITPGSLLSKGKR